MVVMAATGSRNLPESLEQAEAVYRSTPAALPSPDGPVLARRAGHLSSFVRLSVDEPEAMRCLQRAADGLHDVSRLDALLPRVLDGALALTRADFGNVQLLDPASGALTIVTQSGFGSEFTDYFAVVDDDHSACGRAARHCAQTVIADVTTDPGFAPHREIAAASGFRAVQSTPLTDSAGRLVGMVSTHFQCPGRPADRDLRLLELYGDLAGEMLARQLGHAPGGGAAVAATDEEDDSWSWLPGALTVPDAALGEFTGQIVHRLFAVGLSLETARAITGDGAAGHRIQAAVEELDVAIREIRAMVFGRRGPRAVPALQGEERVKA
jgi:hypothetical protein